MWIFILIFLKYSCLKHPIFDIIIKEYWMRKVCLILLGLFLCTDFVSAAVRTQNPTAQSVSRTATQRTKTDTQSTRGSSARANAVTKNAREIKSRTPSNKIVTGRSTTNQRTVSQNRNVSLRTATRAAATTATKTFGSNYTSCRDAYFTCMDQFCATQNESYRRCVCSSKLKDIKKQEQLLSQTADSLKDFEELNIDMISKTANEVKSMLSASEGESAIKKDKSDSAKTLNNISNVLTKSKSTATKNNMDIAGDIKSIWSTTNLIGGADIANLTGEALFNAVHAQCSELVAPDCGESDLKMVSSAYGMYIENDCSMLETNLSKKKTSANAAIRETRHKMQDTRLENYDAHNSVNINDCIANVRKDITADSACGQGYIHCLDFSGKYFNSTTGAPIYSPEFYQIEKQISLSGDVLKNSQNSAFINMLDRKRAFATKSLDLCRDNADDVWSEFLRQALVEIYQGQQERVKTVKNECLKVVNECYLKQSDSLKEFSGNNSKINLGQTLELSEEMCAEKLNTCSNLYGGGPKGLSVLVSTMTGITDATVEQSCPDLLTSYVASICAVPTRDSAHTYPYGCRKYAPGESIYARNALCNKSRINPFSKSDIIVTNVDNNVGLSAYEDMCKIDSTKIYISCKYGYYLYAEEPSCDATNDYCYNATAATECRQCPKNAMCTGDKEKPLSIDNALYEQCGEYYIGSLYQQLVVFAMENCRRPSDTSYTVSETILSHIDNVMNELRPKLLTELSKECEAQSGTWVDIPWDDKNGDGLHDYTGDSLLTPYYVTTGASTLWGYCKQ